MKSKLVYFDSLRGLASLAVVFSHLALIYFPWLHNFSAETIPVNHPIQCWIHNSPFAFFYSGTAAVYLFFVMSGVVLSLSAAKNNLALINTIFGRYARLGIPAIASCIVAYLAFSLVQHVHLVQENSFINSETKIKNPGLFNAIYFGGVRALFYLRGAIQYNPVLWTMALEFYGSLLIFIACKSKRPLWCMGLLSVPFIAINLHVFLGICCFFIGMLIKEKLLHTEHTMSGIIMIVSGLYTAGVHLSSSSYNYLVVLGDSAYEILNFASGVLIVSGTIICAPAKSLLSSRILVRLGKLSFPIYLLHWSIFYVFVNLFNRLNIHCPVIESLFLIILTLAFAVPFEKVDTFSVKISTLLKHNIKISSLKAKIVKTVK